MKLLRIRRKQCLAVSEDLVSGMEGLSAAWGVKALFQLGGGRVVQSKTGFEDE